MQADRGRPRLYCSLKCRQAAYRYRLQAAHKGNDPCRQQLADARRRMHDATTALSTPAVGKAVLADPEVYKAIRKVSKLLGGRT